MSQWFARRHVRRRLALVAASMLPMLAASCGGDTVPTSPSPPAAIIPGARTGPVTITFDDATPAPGATITGCGSQITGCTNRVRMRFVLVPPESGAVLHVVAFLHATNTQACLSAQTGPMALTAGVARSVELVFDRADACGVPLTIVSMAVVVEGTVQVASRQEWLLRYTFER